MKIYRLDIDVAKPINKMVAMQQNTTGMLVVTVTKDGGYLRNATCSVYDGENEIEPYYIEDNHFWFKVDVGIQKKNLTIKASSVPLTSTEKYLVKSGTGRAMSTWCECVQIPAGTYNQDEFASLVRFGSNNGMITVLTMHGDDVDKANFNRITIRPWDPLQQLYFSLQVGSNASKLPQDEPIVVTEEVVFGWVVRHKIGAEFATRDYPSVGYYADYSLDAVIVPSKNADCFGEGDFPEEEPIDSSDSELDSTDTELDSTDTGLDSTDSELNGGDGEGGDNSGLVG